MLSCYFSCVLSIESNILDLVCPLSTVTHAMPPIRAGDENFAVYSGLRIGDCFTYAFLAYVKRLDVLDSRCLAHIR